MYFVAFLFGAIISYEKIVQFGLPIPYIFGVKHFIATFIIFIYCYYYKCFINLRATLVFFAIVIYSFFQLFYNQVNLTSFTISFLFTLFPILTFLLGNSISIKQNIIKKQVYYLVITSILLAIPAALLGVMGYNLRLYTGLYREAAELGGVMVATILYCTYLYRENYLNRRLYYFLLIIPTYIILAQVLKKNILVALVFVLIFIYRERRNLRLKHRILLMLTLMGSLFYLSPQLIENVDDNISYYGNVGFEGHIRLAMYYTAILINVDTFGLGTGLGSFGSLGSLIGEVSLSDGITYKISPIYEKYGLTGIAGNSAEKMNSGDAGTLLDTFWPHIFAELGVYVALLIIFLINSLLKFKKNNYIISFIIIALYLDGLVIILPEAPTFIIYSLFFPGIILASGKHTYNNNSSK